MAECIFKQMIRKLYFIAFFILLTFPLKGYSASQNIIDDSIYTKILDYLLIDEQDVKAYKKIFRNIEKGDFATADKYVCDLENHILLGTVLAQKYLHPKYKSSYSELEEWLKKYSDHVDAPRIYRLAKRKDKKKAKELSYPDIPEGNILSEHKFDDATKHYLQKEVARFKKAIRQGKTKRARLVLEQPKLRKLLPNKIWDDMAATLALKYFVDGYNQLAWQWGSKASRRGTSGTATWVAGLSAWRQHKYKSAASYFSKLANSKNQDEWLVSAGGYWAYRAYNKLGNKKQASEMLKKASQYKHTMYGILASFQLGEKPSYNWESEAYFNNFREHDFIYELVSSPYIRRALVLIKAKQPALAEKELRYGYSSFDEKQQEAVAFIANQFGLHSLAIYVGNQCKNIFQNRSYDAIAYPVPGWWPTHGWKVDKALVLAFVRQESAFKPEAKSNAGACGLMQLMPRTAYHISKDKSLQKNRSKLMMPEYNLELGQQYISYLSGKSFIDGNLFYLLTAYNAGPGNLLKWQKTTKYGNDALLFIESIPSAETRIYIERVMANYWIYNMRLGLKNPTLKQVAKGKWPKLDN
ncbi:MAG: lytic transglycosylase domain-containing protein [Alphaproteobacteria bacterium]|nr:lytic transglycosylase domain-containing protein [Alphaproteobacteria bacterium]